MSQIVVLTGATGFVGRQVLRAFAQQPVKIRLVVRDSKKNQIELTNQIESIVCTSDIFAESQSWWDTLCMGVDTVIHVAWYAEPGKYLQSPKNLDCASGTLALAKACVASKVRRFVGIGTCFEYDLEQGFLSVNTPLKPSTPYAAAKAGVFLALSQYLGNAGIEFAWCRLFYLYGEGEDERRLVPYVRSKLAKGEVAELSSGNQVRDFMDVHDAGQAIMRISKSHRQGPINLCSGAGITVRALAEEIADEYGRRDLLHFGARPDNLIDPPCVVGVLEAAEQ